MFILVKKIFRNTFFFLFGTQIMKELVFRDITRIKVINSLNCHFIYPLGTYTVLFILVRRIFRNTFFLFGTQMIKELLFRDTNRIKVIHTFYCHLIYQLTDTIRYIHVSPHKRNVYSVLK